jgi:hypothetical protein
MCIQQHATPDPLKMYFAYGGSRKLVPNSLLRGLSGLTTAPVPYYLGTMFCLV